MLSTVMCRAVSRHASAACRGHARKMAVSVKVTSRDNLNMKFDVEENETLYTVAHRDGELKERLECACSGNAMCSTCHVYVDESYLQLLDPPQEDELDILDLVPDYQPNSRLGCQIPLTQKLDGITFTIPEEVNNLM